MLSAPMKPATPLVRFRRMRFPVPPRPVPALSADGPVLRDAARKTGPVGSVARMAPFAAMLLCAGPAGEVAAQASDPPRPVPALLADGPVSRSVPLESETGPAHDGAGLASAGEVPGDTRHEQIMRALEAAILRLESDIAELDRLAKWQENLLAAAKTDPDGARRLRRVRSSCLKTPLAAFCDRLNGMYRDVEGGTAARDDDGVQDRGAER